MICSEKHYIIYHICYIVYAILYIIYAQYNEYMFVYYIMYIMFTCDNMSNVVYLTNHVCNTFLIIFVKVWDAIWLQYKERSFGFAFSSPATLSKEAGEFWPRSRRHSKGARFQIKGRFRLIIEHKTKAPIETTNHTKRASSHMNWDRFGIWCIASWQGS